MPIHGREPEAGDPPLPEVAMRGGGDDATLPTPLGSAQSVRSDVGGGGGGGTEEAPTLEKAKAPPPPAPQQTQVVSRESSVSPHDASDDVSSPAFLAPSSLADGDPHNSTMALKRKRKGSGCCACCRSGSAPQDGGRGLSTMYCILLALLATVLPIIEGLQNAWLTEITIAVFLGYLYGVSILFIIFVEIYLLRRAKLRRQKRRARNEREADDNSLQEGTKSFDSGGKNNLAYTSDQTLQSAPNGKGGGLSDYDDFDNKSVKSEVSTMTELFMGDSDPDLDEPLPHRISLFHRIALAVLALGLMIYLGLLLKQLHERHSPAACSAQSAVWPHYVQLAFVLFQTFFIFKHAQVSLHSWQPLFRVGYLHLVVTNWSVVVRALVRETLDAFLKHNVDTSDNKTRGNNPTIDTSAYAPCYAKEDILYDAWPYLYPFILQYSVLAIAAAYSLYADVGVCAIKEEPEKDAEAERAEAERRRRLSYSQPSALNFHKTHRGLFSGLIVMAATFVAVIMFFSYLGNDGYGTDSLSILIYYSSDIAIQFIIALVVLVGWLSARRLSFVWSLEGGVYVDRVLLLVAMTASLLYRLFRILSTFRAMLDGATDINTILTITDLITGVGLNLFQTTFVLDFFCRRCTTRRHLKGKPGRGSLTFLLVTNLALWAFRMFHFKEIQAEGAEVDQAAYGFAIWEFVLHLCVPLSIFYHYQVSASLARVWTDAYRKETVKETLRREAEEQAESIMKSRSMDLHFFPRPSPIMRMIELRRRFRKRDEPEVESETVWSPVSDV